MRKPAKPAIVRLYQASPRTRQGGTRPSKAVDRRLPHRRATCPEADAPPIEDLAGYRTLVRARLAYFLQHVRHYGLQRVPREQFPARLTEVRRRQRVLLRVEQDTHAVFPEERHTARER